jgi:hypothetical protein
MSIGDTPAFNEICSHLRGKIERTHAPARRTVAPVAALVS